MEIDIPLGKTRTHALAGIEYSVTVLRWDNGSAILSISAQDINNRKLRGDASFAIKEKK